MRRIAAVLLVLAGLAGCSGPRAPLTVGVKEVATDVVLGAPKTPSPPAPQAEPPELLPLVQAFPAGIVVAPVRREVQRPVASCPAADPLEPALHASPTRIPGPPAAAAHAYRNDGTFKLVSGSRTTTGRFPPESARSVRSVKTTGDGFTYEVAEQLGGAVTTTTYHVVADSSTTDQTGLPGLYIARVVTRQANGSTSVFAPVPELQLLRVPVDRGASWRAAGTDSASATTMSFTATVATQKARVDACGTWLDAWQVEVRDGLTITPVSTTTFTATYAFATQFGALSVADTLASTLTAGDTTVETKNKATISAQPALAGR